MKKVTVILLAVIALSIAACGKPTGPADKSNMDTTLDKPKDQNSGGGGG